MIIVQFDSQSWSKLILIKWAIYYYYMKAASKEILVKK